MKWVIAPRMRCDLVFFGGLNMSGERTVVQIFAAGGRQGDIDGTTIKSIAVGGEPGTRITLCTSEDEATWTLDPWRCIRIKKGSYLLNQDKSPIVRIPDIDWLDKYDARRNDPDLNVSFEFAQKVADGTEWTFGRPGALKGHIQMIRVDKE